MSWLEIILFNIIHTHTHTHAHTHTDTHAHTQTRTHTHTDTHTHTQTRTHTHRHAHTHTDAHTHTHTRTHTHRHTHTHIYLIASYSKIHNKKERPVRVFFFVSLETTVTFRFNDFLVILMWEYYYRAHRWGNIRIEIC